ncbi:MAG: MutS2 family protein [Candidatus Krumholzibacteriota bacterium]|nr:MutS2 family protein [Candidatus Krumholzibacteriota bacterium]
MSRDSTPRELQGDRFAHAGGILDFASVLELIASRCVNPGAKEKIRALRPTTDSTWIDERLREIQEVREHHATSGHLPLVGTECGEWIERALHRREIIPPEALLAIASVEKSVIELQRSMREETRYPLLRSHISRMRAHRDLVDAVDKAIDRDATIRDTASPHLSSLRKSIAREREALRRHAEQLAKSYGSAEYATYTGARHVLLVPREKCRKKEGIILSSSHSGGSLYFEPFSLVEKNNGLESLFQDERAEETRILGELTGLVVALAEELLVNAEVWELLDGLQAKARFAAEFRCENPARSEDGVLRLADTRHPLLEVSLRARSDGQAAVPLNLDLNPGRRVLVITGPNAGGKTVSLKTLGISVLMFQSGLPLACAEGTRLPIFHAVHADIGDEQSIATSLSTFTSHLRQLDLMCRTSDEKTLCLIDEIGDGTDPDEGSALAIATLERLRSLGATIVATTHYGKVKAYALRTEGVENGSMAYDENSDQPLYRLLQGTAGRSRGIETARRLGFDAPVVRRAEALLGEEPYRLENVLSQLETTQLALERERAALRSQSDVLNRLIATYSEKEASLSRFKEAEQERVKKDVEDLLIRTRKEMEALVKRIRETEADRSVVSEAHRRVKHLLEEVREHPEPKRAKRVVKGDVVSLSPTGRPSGRVIDVNKDLATVDIGGKKLSVKIWNLYKVSEDEAGEPTIEVPVQVTADPLLSTTIDVRGQSREEALDAVDRFLDRAVLTGVQEVRIIHGVGEGVLLGAIRDLVRSDARVDSSRQGSQAEGGLGVTLVHLK